MTKRWKASLLVVAMLGTTIMAGCSGTNQTSGDDQQSDKRIPIEAMEVGYGTPMPEGDGDFVKTGLDEALGIDFTLTLTGSGDELSEKLNVRAASNDLPDIIQFASKVQYQEYARKGLLLDLTPHIDKLDKLQEGIGEATFDRAKVDGKVYGWTKNPSSSINVIWVRKDWLEALQLPVPTTLDEVVEVAKAFVEQDPDGNGKKDTIGITGDVGFFGLIHALHGVAGGISQGSPADFFMKGDTIVSALSEPETREAIAYIQELTAAGVLDPEIASNKLNTALDKAFQGKAGIIYTDWTRIMKDEEVAKWQEANPDADWTYVPSLTGPSGLDTAGVRDAAANAGIFGISKAIAQDGAKLDKIFELLNYIAVGDGSLLVQFGVEDTHFKQENGQVMLTDKASDAAFSWVYQLSGRPEREYLSTKFPKQVEHIEHAFEVPLLITYNDYIELPPGFNSADAIRYRNEELLKFYYSKESLDQFDTFLNKLDTTFNLKLYKDEAMKQFKELGLTKE
jgi:putative aldouronate transport system substrate-binding protein